MNNLVASPSISFDEHYNAQTYYPVNLRLASGNFHPTYKDENCTAQIEFKDTISNNLNMYIIYDQQYLQDIDEEGVMTERTLP